MSEETVETNDNASMSHEGDKSTRRSRSNVCVPTFEESLQMELLEGNLIQAENYMNTFSNEKDTLGTTYSQCREIIVEEFEKVYDLLTKRKEILLKELEKRFEERDNKIDGQINELQNHCNNNENTEDECKELLGTMIKRDEKPERTLKIKKLCQDCIKQSPSLQEVPIDLKHKFVTQKKLFNLINEYGALICKRIELGRKRKFKTVFHDIRQHEHFVGDKPNYDTNSNGTNKVINQKDGGGDHDETVDEVEENVKRDVTVDGAVSSSELELEEKVPDKVKISCKVVVNGGESKDKILVLKKGKNDYRLAKVTSTIERMNIVKQMIKEFGTDKINFNYCMIENGGNVKDIDSDDDLIKYVVMTADPDAKIPVCIQAKLIITE